MPRETQEFEQDFVLVTETEMRVRQATQYAQLSPTLLSNPHEDIWEWDANDLDGEQLVDGHLDEQYTTVWERMLERL
jgi:hypothetical protein